MFSEERSYSAGEKAWRIAVCFLLVVVLPIAAIIIFAAPPDFSKPGPSEGTVAAWLGDNGWWLALAGFLIAGIVGIHFLPVGRWMKAGLSALYVPLGAAAIFVFTLVWGCHCCGGCI